MNEKTWKLTLPAAIIILGVCKLIAASMISGAIREVSGNNESNGFNDSELTRFNDNFEEFILVFQENNVAEQ